MAYTPFEELGGQGPVTIDSNTQHTLTANGQEVIELPSGDFIADAQMTKDGHDLVLEAPDGSVVVIEGYFLAEPAPVLQAPNGAALTPELVDAFAKAPSEFAQTGSLNDESPVGTIEELSGEARIIRADGTVETVQIGTPVYQGDVIETSGDGAVNIVFIDETSFAISENARMAIDEYVFDPATESGKQNFSVLRGVFVFTSGLIGRDDPDDVEIDTPVGSIGIRGTIIAGNIQPGGESEITVIEGAIVIRNGVNEETLSLQFESVKLNGYDAGIERTGVMDADSVNQNYGSVRNVSPALFSSIDDSAQEQNEAQSGTGQQDQQQDAADQQPADNQSQLEGDPDQPVQNGEAAPTESAPQQPAPGTKDPALNNLDGTKNNFDGQNDAFTGDNTIVEGAQQPAPTGGTTQTQTAGTSTAAAQPAPNGTTGTQTTTQAQTTTNPPPLGLEVQKFDLPVGGFTAGFIVGRVKTTNLFGQVDFTLVSGGGNFELVKIGTHEAVIRLTATGYSNIAGTGAANFNFTVEAVRNGTTTKSVSFSSHIFDPTAGIPDGYGTDLFAAGNDGVTVITDSGIGNRIGSSITGGRFNADGFSDIIFTNDTNRVSAPGLQHHNYFVAGNAGLDGASPSDGPVGTAANVVDYNIHGGTSNPTTDYNDAIAVNIGDYDGDGIDDIAMGFQNSNSGTGEVFIYKSDSGGSSETVNTSSISGSAGVSIGAAGDLNLDGLADVIIGSTVGVKVFSSGFTPFDLSQPVDTLLFGMNVAGAGDYNGDGFADVVVSALDTPSTSGTPGDGRAFIYYGDGAGGLTLGATFSGFDTNNDDLPLFNVGDVNGDGRTDLMMVSIGDNGDNGTGYIVLGGTGGGAIGSQAVLKTNSSDLKLHGAGAAGDWNGDGFDDFVLVTDGGSDGSGDIANIYVVYGKAGLSGTIDQAWLNDPQNAFKTSVFGIDDINEFDFTISNVGDMNGDGFDEVAIGTPDFGNDVDGSGGDANNDGNTFNDTDGQVAILYGRETSGTKVGTNVVATANGDSLVGTVGNDTLSDRQAGLSVAKNVSMRGGAGDDTFKIFATTFSASPLTNIDGGSGFDTIMAQSGLDFADLDFEQMSGIEQIKAQNGATNITLTVENIFNLLQTSDSGKLYISESGFGTNNLTIGAPGDPTDDVYGIATAMGESAGSVTIGGGSLNGETYDKISIGNYELYIDQDFSNIVVS